MKIYILLITLFTYSNFAFGQLAIFKWEDETCVYKSEFDSTLYSRKQIEDSYKYAYHAYMFDNNQFHVFEPEHKSRINLDLFDREYNNKIQKLESLQFIKGQKWDSIRDIHIKEINLSHKLLKAQYLVLLDSIPPLFKTYFAEDEIVDYYANALISGGDSLLQAWDKLTKESLPRNINPDKKLKQYQEKLKSNERLEYAKIDVLNFGWWNNVNRHIQHISTYPLQVNFNEIFVKTEKIDCDEP